MNGIFCPLNGLFFKEIQPIAKEAAELLSFSVRWVRLLDKGSVSLAGFAYPPALARVEAVIGLALSCTSLGAFAWQAAPSLPAAQLRRVASAASRSMRAKVVGRLNGPSDQGRKRLVCTVAPG